MQALGHPILGDPFYSMGSARDFPRLMLHSEELRFKHPQGGRSMKIRAAAPFLKPAKKWGEVLFSLNTGFS